MKTVDEDEIQNPLLRKGYNGSDHGSNDARKTGRRGFLFSAMTYAKARTIYRQRSMKMPSKEPWVSKIATEMANFFERLRRRPVMMPLKAGISACIASCVRFIPGPLSFLNKNGVWAVITSDIVLEPTVGSTFSKGINRAAGTLVAAALALGVDHAAQALGQFEPLLLMFCTFLGGAIPSVFKFRRPFRDRWNYSVVMAMITFHLLILSKSEYSEKVQLPLVRMLTIVFGFVIASFVNVLIAPEFAGDAIHLLLSKNFTIAASAIERCVSEYCKGTVLQQIPQLLGNAKITHNDDLHACFHEVLTTDSQLDNLRAAVRFEPCHGKFFWGYPWLMYEDVADNLRHLLYDVVALDSCLRAEIQASMPLRHMFQEDFLALGSHCAQIMQTISESIKHMQHFDCRDIVLRAEEYALLLQHKISQSIPEILRDSEDTLNFSTKTLKPQLDQQDPNSGSPDGRQHDTVATEPSPRASDF
ncbi:hypothetical protein O6H91_Y089100 [Diphasiastrum complanatum]|nr:hypothetical protein O6H91_Y089100 [Diphasiastrum complanatum]